MSGRPYVISSDLGRLGRIGTALERTVGTDRLSPSYLFEGADAQAVHEVARAFAAAILAAADARGDDRARVERLVANGTHPDLHLCGKDKPTVISVAALTVLLEEAHGTPVAGRRQVFIIDPAEAMEPEGLARYLKALEEPPDGTVFLLVSTRPDRLPATVLSRVRRIRVPPLSPEDVAECLRADGLDASGAKAFARWAGGSLSRARRLAVSEIPDVAQVLVDAASGAEPRAALAAEQALALLTRHAAARAEESGEERPDMKRQFLRTLLTDVLHVVRIEARDRVAGRPSAWLGDLDAEGALRLLEALGDLGAAVASNVSPSVIVLELVRRLRDRLRS